MKRFMGMRENRLAGANMLVNITSDVWYPNSRLGKQHFDHARLRTVEMGIPLLRSCNYGVTAGVDSLGSIIDSCGGNTDVREGSADALLVKVSTYHYRTLYAFWGDYLIIGASFFFILIGLKKKK
jgi:apolipoprotein N-acyltransferase